MAKKSVRSHGLRVGFDGRLLIPMLNSDLEIVGLQYIDDDGAKMFLTGSKKKASFLYLGRSF